MDDRQIIKVLKALADPKRFAMVRALADGKERSCSEVGEGFAVAQPTISHHLKILVDSGVLVVRQDARHHFLTVDHELLAQVTALIPTAGPTTRAMKKPARRKKPA
jgi:ArsR family transcriptional regulator, arsenate/arsenite/antimonite-responsive transcriptional repressor